MGALPLVLPQPVGDVHVVGAGFKPARARHTLMSNKRSSMEWVPCHSFSLSR